jgi:hypothetical protein
MNFFISYLYLKVPKSFNRSDFQDFYTINPFLEDDFGVKILTCHFTFGGARHHLISDTHAERAYQFLTCMHSALINSWCAHSLHASVPDAYAHRPHQFLTRLHNARISSWRKCSVYASVPESYAQHAHKGRSMCVRKSKILIIFKVRYLKLKILYKIVVDAKKWSQKLHNNFFWPIYKNPP